MKKKKLFSRCLCLGFIWGMVSWVLYTNSFVENVFSIYTIPVFLSNKFQDSISILGNYQKIYMMSFLLSILVGGLIGYFSAFVISNVFKKQYKEGNF